MTWIPFPCGRRSVLKAKRTDESFAAMASVKVPVGFEKPAFTHSLCLPLHANTVSSQFQMFSGVFLYLLALEPKYSSEARHSSKCDPSTQKAEVGGSL